MVNQTYRDAMTDLYRFVEKFEDVPCAGADDGGYWDKCSKALKDIIEKYPGMPEVHEWALGIYAGLERIAKRK